jgi:hypothetical protein
MTYLSKIADKQDRMQRALDDVLKSRTAVLATVSGSALYGTATDQSDDDVRAVFLPLKREILLGRTSFGIDGNEENNRLGAGDIDVSAVSLQRYLALIGKMDMISVEILFAARNPAFCIQSPSPVFDLVWKNRDKLLAGSGNSAIGHARQRLGDFFPSSDATLNAYRQAEEILSGCKGASLLAEPALLEKLQAIHRVEVVTVSNQRFAIERKWEDMTDEERATGKSPGHSVFVKIGGKRIGTGVPISEALRTVRRPLNRKEVNKRTSTRGEAIVWKDAYQAVRLLHQVVEIHQTRDISLPRPEAALLRKIRNAELSEEDLKTMISELMENVADAEMSNPFPEHPCPETWENVICEAHEMVVRGQV